MYMIDKIQNWSPFSLVSLMIHVMRNTGFDTTKKRVFFSYPVLLTRVFQAWNINFTGELRESTWRSRSITFDTINN